MKLKSITNFYNKTSNFGKILLFISLLLILMSFFRFIDAKINNKGFNIEGYTQNDNYLFKTGNDVYDSFYATIYDHLVFNSLKNNYETEIIMNKSLPTNKSVVLDVGCGTGHHVANLSSKNINVIGVDISQPMINKAKEKYPKYNFIVGDVLNRDQFQNNSFTHILCLYFTVYYFKDKRLFFNNCMDWLMPGGHLIVHLVNREKFDPILPPGNPLYIVSPQKYAKERITNTKITFNDFVYESNFNFNKNKDLAVFEEKFKFNNGKIRKQEQVLYMENTSEILTIAEQCGFTLKAKVDLVKCAYENQYLYILVKPS
jgi:ubiquinone/menaquinone biosynthesis C-methylase UbiE